MIAARRRLVRIGIIKSIGDVMPGFHEMGSREHLPHTKHVREVDEQTPPEPEPDPEPPQAA